MGIVLKQTFKGAMYSYLGVILGGINVAILFPIIFSEEEIGLVNILVSVSAVCAQFSSLGAAGVINYFFPKFRNNNNAHNGFFIFVSLFASIGFILFSIFFYFKGDSLLVTKVTDTTLQDQYYYLLYPFTFFSLAFILTDMFSASTFNAVIGNLYKDVVVRVFILILSVLYYFEVFDFSTFIVLYTFNMAIPVIAVLLYLIKKKDIQLKWPNFAIYRPHLKKITSVGFFYIFSGLSNILATYIDKFMISYFIGLGPTGIYSITNYFGALTRIPRSSMGKIGTPIVAKLLEEEKYDELSDLLKKSSLSQTLVGIFIFIGIWVNIDLILSVLPPAYTEGKWVVFFISLSFLVYCFQGFCGLIIQVSKHYKISTYFTIALGVMVVVFNYALIPVWGITGAAFSTALAKTIFVVMNLLFVRYKLKMKVLFFDSLKIMVSGIGAYYLAYIIPLIHFTDQHLVNTVLNIGIKSTVITVSFVALLLITRFIKDIRAYKNYL